MTEEKKKQQRPQRLSSALRRGISFLRLISNLQRIKINAKRVHAIHVILNSPYPASIYVKRSFRRRGVRSELPSRPVCRVEQNSSRRITFFLFI